MKVSVGSTVFEEAHNMVGVTKEGTGVAPSGFLCGFSAELAARVSSYIHCQAMPPTNEV